MVTSHILEDSVLQQIKHDFTTIFSHIDTISNTIPEAVLGQFIENKTVLYRIYHLLEVMEFYIGNTPEEMDWGKLIGIDWDNTDEKDTRAKMEAIDVNMILNYKSRIAEKVSTFVTNNALTDKTNFPWLEHNLARIDYVIRHTYWHLGEVYGYLKERGHIIHWR